MLEGLTQYAAQRNCAAAEVDTSVNRAVEFLLENRLFYDSPDSRFRRLTYPHRYRYDLLRALTFFARSEIPYDARMLPALGWLDSKRLQDGYWPLEYAHPGNVHFELEPVGEPSRFITLHALMIESYFSRAVSRA